MSSWQTRVAAAFTAAIGITAGSDALADPKADIQNFCAGQRAPYTKLYNATRNNDTKAAASATTELLAHQSNAKVFSNTPAVNVTFEAHGKKFSTPMHCDDITYRQCGSATSLSAIYPTAGYYQKIHGVIMNDVGTKYETAATVANSKAAQGQFWHDKPEITGEHSEIVRKDLINLHGLRAADMDNAINECKAKAEALGIFTPK